MEQKKYWQSFGEMNHSEAYQQSLKDEFQEELPFEAEDNSSFLQAKTPRRDFLKYLGFSTAAAAAAASCETPLKKAIPFANRPEEVMPGMAKWYASTYVQDGDVAPVLVKVRDGRPIKVEGNNLSSIYRGGTSPKVQASVLDLYDGARIRKPFINNNEATFEAIDKAVAADLAALGGRPVVLLTSTIVSPSTKEVINQFLAKYPGSRHVQYDAVSYSGMLLANEQSGFGRRIPSYNFDKAKVIVSLAADFLGTWLNPIEFNKQYAKGRKINQANPSMSRHFHFESVLSQTGANADERYLHRPSEMGKVAAALLGAINGTAVSGFANDDFGKKLTAGLTKAAKELAANRGAALVVSGSNDVNVQIIVNAINNAIGAYGTTIDWATPLNIRQGIDADVETLVADMNGGRVGGLFILGANPVYSWVDADGFKKGMEKVGLKVSFNPKWDETTQLCKYVIPNHHYLESWGDAEPKAGHYSFMQPTINPLFKTRQWQDSLLKWSGNTATPDYASFLKTYWGGRLGGEHGWNKVLQDGVYPLQGETAPVVTTTAPGSAGTSAQTARTTDAQTGSGTTIIIDSTDGEKTITYIKTTTADSGTYNSAAVANALNIVNGYKGGTYELFLYESNGVGDGSGAANPWLQELPDPITRATWDNYVIVSPAFAKKHLDINLEDSGEADHYEVYPSKPVVEVSVNGRSVKLPALIIPGTHPNAIGIAVGYGRTSKIGKAATHDGKPIGANVYQFATWKNGTVDLANYNVEIKNTGEDYKVALVQTHNTYDTNHGKRTEVIKELSFKSFAKNPKQVLDERDQELKAWGGIEKFEKEGTVYPYYEKPGAKWGMVIDMNACTGCGACVVACHIENNVPIVGKSEVLRFHDMHWLRIDRYYSGDMNNPDVTFQPMLCQHCDNAPCENVCPVAATMHSNEGINQMVYNRCIGTRYCANNCPYKVRRFNWADYTGADSFPNNQDEMSDVVMMMNDQLTRMVLNPDVTVRARGVMEKCTFCIQRCQDGKLEAKKQNRPVKTGEDGQWDLKTACQQACPADAIVFGNVNSSKSEVSRARAENTNRSYYSLEFLHTVPNITYLAKVRNSDNMEEHGHASTMHGDKAENEGEAAGGTHGN